MKGRLYGSFNAVLYYIAFDQIQWTQQLNNVSDKKIEEKGK